MQENSKNLSNELANLLVKTYNDGLDMGVKLERERISAILIDELQHYEESFADAVTKLVMGEQK